MPVLRTDLTTPYEQCYRLVLISKQFHDDLKLEHCQKPVSCYDETSASNKIPMNSSTGIGALPLRFLVVCAEPTASVRDNSRPES